MPVKIRLQRHGKKGKPFYWVVAADSRSKRDGRYLEKLGTYNPNTNPATLKIDVDSAVHWLQNGAQPTDTARNLLSEVGAMLKNHLVNGVHKGALKEEDVETKFEAWLAEKSDRIQTKKEGLDKSAEEMAASKLAAEKEVNEKRAQELAATNSTLVEEVNTEETPAEEPKAEEAPAEEPKAEETPAEEPKAEETPAEEPKAEETPAEEPKAE